MSADIELRQLRAFLAVVEHGTLGRAARALGLAQSTVSESLAALDRALGTTTIRRTRGGHRAALTTAGKALLPHARKTLAELDTARTAVASVSRTVKARIDVIANESVSTYLLPAALRELRKSWPAAKFIVSIDTCDTIRSRVGSAGCDLGLMLECDVDGKGLGARSLRRTTAKVDRWELRGGIDLVVVAAPRHPLVRSHARPHSRAALTGLSMFVADGAGDFHDLLSSYFAADATGARLEVVGTIEAVRRAAASDTSSLGILPRYAVAEELRAGRLREVAFRPAPPAMRLVAIAPAESPRHPAIAQLIEQLKA